MTQLFIQSSSLQYTNPFFSHKFIKYFSNFLQPLFLLSVQIEIRQSFLSTYNKKAFSHRSVAIFKESDIDFFLITLAQLIQLLYLCIRCLKVSVFQNILFFQCALFVFHGALVWLIVNESSGLHRFWSLSYTTTSIFQKHFIPKKQVLPHHSCQG